MPVIYCPECHRMVTMLSNTEDGKTKIGNMLVGNIQGSITLKCRAGHKVKIKPIEVQNGSRLEEPINTSPKLC